LRDKTSHSARIDGEQCTRAYTPTSGEDAVGFFDLVVKIYRRGVDPEFPAGGKMSQFLDALSVGDAVAVQGQCGQIEFLGSGRVRVRGEQEARVVKDVGLICGGTGITPAYQVVDTATIAAMAIAVSLWSSILLQ
jgi:nitrate reductase (NAD(P)H)